MNVDVDVGWIASALGCVGFLTAVGLAMTVGRLRCYGMSATVKLSLRGLRQLNYDYSTSPKQSSWPMCINFDFDVAWIASALYYTGFSTAVGLAMTVGRCVANWMSTTVKLSLRGQIWLKYDTAQGRSNPAMQFRPLFIRDFLLHL